MNWVAFLLAEGRSATTASTFCVVSLGSVTEQIRDFMLCGMQRFAQGSVFTPQIVVSLLGTNKFRFQAEEFMHDRFPVCLRLFELFFEQQFHDIKVGFEIRLQGRFPPSSQQLSRSVL